MDSYRVGTLLELIRDVATRLACSGRRVRVCVQAPMGRGDRGGLPLSLNGVRRILEMMDWGSDRGQEYEGIVPNYVRFGSIGGDEVDRDERGGEAYDGGANVRAGRKMARLPPDDVFLVIAPQNSKRLLLIMNHRKSILTRRSPRSLNSHRLLDPCLSA